MRVYVYTTLIILYIVSRFISESIVHYSVGILGIIAIVVSAFYARGIYAISGTIFFILGTILFIFTKQPWYTFILHFEQVLGLLSLFFVLPFMNSLIHVGRYDQNLSILLQNKITNLSKLYRRSFGVCYLLGLFLNIATIPLLVKSLNATLRDLPKNTVNKYYTQNLLRAYALCLIWSPMEVMVSTTIDIANVKYYMILPILLFIALMAVMFDWLLSSCKYKNIPISFDDQRVGRLKNVYQKVAQLVGVLVLFILIVSLVQHVLNNGFLFSVVLLIVPFAILWAILISKIRRYMVIAIRHWKERTNGLANYFFMFLSAGLFVEMLSQTKLLSALEPIFELTTERTLLLYLMIGAYFLVTSLIGFHPLVGLTLLAEILQPILPKVPAIPLAVTLICCSLSTVMYSPYNISISILADELKTNPYRLGLWNIGFAICLNVFSIFVAFSIEKII